MPKMEEADISGQGHISNDFLHQLKQVGDNSPEQHFNLKRIILSKDVSIKETCDAEDGYKLDLKIPSLEIKFREPENNHQTV